MNTTYHQSGGAGGSGGSTEFAGGGLFRGAGTTTSDSNRAPWISDKEYIVKAAAVEKFGIANLDRINSMKFAAGGYVGSSGSGSPGSMNVAAPQVHVYVDGQEFKGLVRVELGKDAKSRLMQTRQMIDGNNRALADGLTYGGGF